MKILSQRSCSFSPAVEHGLVRDLTWCCPWLGTGDAHTVMSVGTTLEMRCLQLLPDCLCNMLSITKHRNKNIGENLVKATALHQFLYLITSWSLPLGLWTSWSLLGYGPPISTGPSTSRQCTSSLTPGWHAGCGHWRHQATQLWLPSTCIMFSSLPFSWFGIVFHFRRHVSENPWIHYRLNLSQEIVIQKISFYWAILPQNKFAHGIEMALTSAADFTKKILPFCCPC